jgi:hypothetical protein
MTELKWIVARRHGAPGGAPCQTPLEILFNATLILYSEQNNPPFDYKLPAWNDNPRLYAGLT